MKMSEPNEDDISGFGAFMHSAIRASGFVDLYPRLRRVVLGEEEEVTEEHRHLHHERHGSNSHQNSSTNDAGQDNASEHPPPHADEESPLLGDRASNHSSDSTNELTPLRSTLSKPAQERVQHMAKQRDETRAKRKQQGGEREQLLVTHVRRDDGTEAEVIIGQSTLPQTIFNSSNTLIGIGLLSLPLAFRYTGWIIGVGAILLSSSATRYTAGLLAKCLDVDSSLANFGDIAFVAFGEKGRGFTNAFITLELLITCVSLIILFGDTLESLIDGPSKTTWKVICGCVLIPLNFLPMRLLGFTSILGIFCSIAIIIIAFVVGGLKPHAPGSLREVATTHALPPDWKALPLSFGLIMALWTGHSVFPNIYRDMRHPPKYGPGLKVVFVLVTSVDFAMAIVGYLLYGDELLDELTSNMIKTRGYPYAVQVLVLVLILIVILTKFPLQCSPIVSTLEVYTGIDMRAALLKPNRFNQSKFLTKCLKTFFRVLVVVVTTLIAIAVPSFELVSAIMGGFFGYSICIIIPIAFHLKMFRDRITKRQLIVDLVLILVSVILGAVGTVWEFLPENVTGS